MTKNTSDQDTLSHSMVGGRLRRYAKVTSAMGGLAARLLALGGLWGEVGVRPYVERFMNH